MGRYLNRAQNTSLTTWDRRPKTINVQSISLLIIIVLLNGCELRFLRLNMHINKIALLLLIFISVSLKSANAEQQITVTKMGNGLTVIMKQNNAAELVGIDIWVKAGSAYETTENNGVSHFIEHMIYGATNTRENGQMDIEMETIGATLDAHTSQDWAHFSTTVAAIYMDKALELMADAITNPLFREIDMEKEKPVLLDEISRKQSDVKQIYEDILSKEIYGDHPYSLPVEGTYKSISDMTRDKILNYYKKYYVPQNMAVVIVGDIETKTTIDKIGQTFGKAAFAKEFPTVSIPLPKPIIASVDKKIATNLNKNYICIGFLGPAANEYDDVIAADVLFTYLGLGYRSWLDTELVQRQKIATLASAEFLTHQYPALMSFFAEVKSDPVLVKTAIFSKLTEIQNIGISEIDLDTAKRSVLGQFAFQNETYGGQANSLGFYYAISAPSFSIEYVNRVQNIKVSDIINFAKKYLSQEKTVVITLTGKEKVN